MISSSLKRQVRREANLIRKRATQEELDKLDIKTLAPRSVYFCIYGQMTGDCHSDRAKDLLGMCAVPVSDGNFSRLPTRLWKHESWGVSLGHQFRGKYSAIRDKYSAIETYIAQPKAKNRALVRYLKGKTDVLDI